MPSLTAWRTLLRLLDDPHEAGFEPDHLRQLPGGRELLDSGLLIRSEAPFLAVDHGPRQELVEYFPDESGRLIRYRCPETGRLLTADPRRVLRYAASAPRIADTLREQLGIASAVREWNPTLSLRDRERCESERVE